MSRDNENVCQNLNDVWDTNWKVSPMYQFLKCAEIEAFCGFMCQQQTKDFYQGCMVGWSYSRNITELSTLYLNQCSMFILNLTLTQTFPPYLDHFLHSTDPELIYDPGTVLESLTAMVN